MLCVRPGILSKCGYMSEDNIQIMYVQLWSIHGVCTLHIIGGIVRIEV